MRVPSAWVWVMLITDTSLRPVRPHTGLSVAPGRRGEAAQHHGRPVRLRPGSRRLASRRSLRAADQSVVYSPGVPVRYSRTGAGGRLVDSHGAGAVGITHTQLAPSAFAQNCPRRSHSPISGVPTPASHGPYFRSVQVRYLNGGTSGASRGAAGARFRSFGSDTPVSARSPCTSRMCDVNAARSVPDARQISGAGMPAWPSVRSQRQPNSVPCSSAAARTVASCSATSAHWPG